MKRPLSLSAFIIGTVFYGIEVFSTLIVLSVVIPLTMYNPEQAGGVGGVDGYYNASIGAIVAVFVLMLAFAITSLVLNACAISSWNKPHETYLKKRGLIITAVVLNFIVIVLEFAGFFLYFNPFSVFTLLGIITANVLVIVDLCLENGRVRKLAEAPVAKPAPAPPKNKLDIEVQLERLNKMKENNLISAEEYKTLKKDLIEKHISK